MYLLEYWFNFSYYYINLKYCKPNAGYSMLARKCSTNNYYFPQTLSLWKITPQNCKVYSVAML